MKLDTVMWLLPVVFILHDFEEIIMFRPWLDENQAKLAQRFPWFEKHVLPLQGSLSTSGFAFGVMIIFLSLSIATFLAVEKSFYSLWMGILLVFFLHLIIHIIQFLVMRRYVPVIISSLLASGYCVYVLLSWQHYAVFHLGSSLVWAAVVLLLTVVLVPGALVLGSKMDRLLFYPKPRP